MILLFQCINSLWAQGDWDYYLQNARRHLNNGDCIRATINYNAYKELSHDIDSEIERKIKECNSGTNLFYGENLFGDQLESVNAKIIEMVKTFQHHVKKLAGNKLTHEEKMDRYEQAMNLFINEGKEYEIIVPGRYGEYTEMHDPVQMCVITSKYSQNRKKYPMTQYLTTLIINSENPNYRYKEIVIENSDFIKIDNYAKVGEGKYMALAHYVQKYSAYRSTDVRTPSYVDYTQKTIAVYIDIAEVPQSDGRIEKHIMVYLGDVDCEGEAW